MSVLRMAVAEAIAATIAAGVPGFASAAAGADDEEELPSYPALRVLPRRMELIPMDEDEIETDDILEPAFTDVQLASVGEFEGIVEIRIYCLSRVQRNKFEDAVLALFLENEGAPGTLPVSTAPVMLKGLQSAYQAPVCCSLDTDEWDDERVFDKKRYSFLSVNVNFPVLIARTNAPRMNQILLEISTDLDAPTYDEVVQVNADGSLSPST